MESRCSRRVLLSTSAKGAAALLIASPLTAILLGSCTKSRKNDADAKKTNNADPSSTPCPDQDKLTAQETSIRDGLKYVDQSPLPARRCDNCKLYVNAVKGALCGGCKVVPGPIHPQGHCTAWVQLI